MRFDINDYKGKYVMHCKTKEEAESFCKYLDSTGRTWCNGDSYLKSTEWYCYKDKTIYYFNNSTFSNIENITSDYKILEWEDFMNKEFTKADLKTGDVILRRNGDVEIVNRELDMLICKNCGWNDLKSIQEDLTDICGEIFNIVKVKRPNKKSDCCFNAMENDCLGDRKSVV